MGVEDPTFKKVIISIDVVINFDRGDVSMMDWKTNDKPRISKIISWISYTKFHNDGFEYKHIKIGQINRIENHKYQNKY